MKRPPLSPHKPNRVREIDFNTRERSIPPSSFAYDFHIPLKSPPTVNLPPPTFLPPSNDDDNCSSNVVIIFPILCFISGMEDGAPLEIKVNVIKFYVRLMEDDVRSKMAALHFFSLSFSLFDLLFRRPAYLRKYPAHLHVICIIGSENTLLLLPSPRKKEKKWQIRCGNKSNRKMTSSSVKENDAEVCAPNLHI